MTQPPGSRSTQAPTRGGVRESLKRIAYALEQLVILDTDPDGVTWSDEDCPVCSSSLVTLRPEAHTPDLPRAMHPKIQCLCSTCGHTWDVTNEAGAA